jgi:hypothetical protein
VEAADDEPVDDAEETAEEIDDASVSPDTSIVARDTWWPWNKRQRHRST